jgi:hypothetical protein
MEKTALGELERLSKAAENSVVLIQRLLNLLKNMDLSTFGSDDIKFAIQAICFQLTQMDNVPTRCNKLRSQFVKAHDLQSIKKIEEDCSYVEAVIREIFMLFKSEIKDFESILNSHEIKNFKGIQLLYKLARPLH